MVKQFKSHLEENVSADAIIDKLQLLVLIAHYWFDSIFRLCLCQWAENYWILRLDWLQNHRDDVDGHCWTLICIFLRFKQMFCSNTKKIVGTQIAQP